MSELQIDTIYNSDCIVGMKQIPNNSIDLILTDPPYMISKKSNFDKGGGVGTMPKVKTVEKLRPKQPSENGIKVV